ncbi:hypothetical protein HX005_04105 [Acinetobacter sp. R933-2]|uniref:hypothetical protein n=1 Tax=Acinetobacter sp. R933-2 TaxID=2746728 RepID=UPI0025765FFE|nr:hypothetical protein [Acinetobacter sp. R933-2]MDM1246575.1 hypothetical protein [Acinetobacter sp. R933-2]
MKSFIISCCTLFILINLNGCQTQSISTLSTDSEIIEVKPCTGNDTEVCQEIPDQNQMNKIKRTYTDQKGCQYTEYENGLTDAICP